MINKVYEFNKIRNGFAFDEALEIKMYQEEKTEFYEAEHISERVDAYCDMEYVIQGSELKSTLHGVDNPNWDNWSRMEPLARGIISMELLEYGLDFNNVISAAREIVANANEVKGTSLNKDGKVSKDTFVPDATKQIKSMIEKKIEEGNK